MGGKGRLAARAMVVTVAAAALVAAEERAGAQALAAASEERVELFLGMGSVASVVGDFGRPVVPWVQTGGAIWFVRDWGLAVRYARSGRQEFANEVWSGRVPHRYLLSGTRYFEYWTATLRYRVRLDDGTELTVGGGVQLGGREDVRLRRRESLLVMDALTEAERAELRPIGDVDEARRVAQGRGFAVEALVGRRLWKKVGVGGGIVFQWEGRGNVRYEAIGVGRLGF